jgi:hypothetical protein
LLFTGLEGFEIISGQKPFHRFSDGKVGEELKAGATLQEDFEVFGRFVPKKLIQLFQKCHEKEPQRRPSFGHIKALLPDCFRK